MTILLILPKPVPEDITLCIKVIKPLIFKQKEWEQFKVPATELNLLLRQGPGIISLGLGTHFLL